jgi:hypothetical protein
MVSKNYKTCSTQFLFHLLIALPINFLHHPLPGNQTKPSVTFGCGYLTAPEEGNTTARFKTIPNISLYPVGWPDLAGPGSVFFACAVKVPFICVRKKEEKKTIPNIAWSSSQTLQRTRKL